MKKIILITGGQRSGKSSYAERLALSLSPTPVYLATAHAWDEEFIRRIENHKARRGTQWTNIEEERFLSQHNVNDRVIVVDCVTLWCTNFFFSSSNEGKNKPDVSKVLSEMKAEFDKFTAQNATFIFVTNEIGSGEISSNPLQRQFTDLQGWLNQYIASKADEVILMTCGIEMKIKG